MTRDSPVETVLFDLDDTLVRYRRSPDELLQHSYEACGIDPVFTVEEYYDRFDELRAEYDSVDALRAACFASLAADYGHNPAVGREIAAAYAESRAQTNVEFLPGAPAVLDSLDAPVGIVTNGTSEAQQAKIDAVGLSEWVDVTVCAGDSVPAKPATEPFERALDALDADPETTVHVGDSLSSDIAGANAAGLRSVWLQAGGAEPGEHEPAHRISSLDDLPEYVDR